MMTNKHKNVPELRFKGFTDDWEQRKLSDLTEYADYRGKSPSKKENGIQLITASNIRFGYIDYDADKQYVSKDDYPEIMRRGLPKMGDVLFTTEAPLGNVAQVDSENIALAQRVIKFTGKRDLIINDYLFEYFLTPSFQTEINKKASGGTVKGIKGKVLHQTLINFPKLLEEQQKIGTFFKQLDDTLALHQRKLDLLKEQKKGFLQKMFPKNGETVPELRFEGFVDAWEQEKLGNLAEIVRGASPRPIQDSKWFDDESEIGWLRISDVTEQDGRIRYLGQHISKLGQEKTRVLVEPHLLLSIAATVGKPVVNYVKTGVHDGFLIFQNPKFEQEFMFQWLEMFRSMWSRYGQPGSQVNLNSDLVKNQDIMIPTIEEQTKIGLFFKQLDSLITLHQRKLDLLKEQKKGFLQKMFV